MSFLKEQLKNIAWSKEQLLKEGFTPEEQEEAFQEDMFFPKANTELTDAKNAVRLQFENKQFDETKAARLNQLLSRSLDLYKNAARELRKDRVATEKAVKAAEEAYKKQQEGKPPVVETENVKVEKKGWLSKNKWWVIGGLAVVATVITVVVIKRRNK
jgi:hypothetical protein